MPPKRNDIPNHLRNLQQEEALYIKSIFGVYDYRATGLIPRHCVGKILDKIGVEASILSLPQQMSLREVLLFIGAYLHYHRVFTYLNFCGHNTLRFKDS